MNKDENDEILSPLIITPGQYVDRRRPTPQDPLKRLMAAILEDALVVYTHYRSATKGKHRNLWRDARDWLFVHGGMPPFDFTTVTDTLGIDADPLRKRIVSLEPDTKFARRSPVRIESISIARVGRRSL